ncbi:uncharacterized protein [Battus philenor]|uniref:uncharacterized protein n=1 Tax=Battus philenor TaxID=42288 RepID=UPI0035D063AE
MTNNENLKENHVQKYYLKKICYALHWFGLGDFWYEKFSRRNRLKSFYLLWMFLANAYIFLMIANEMLAHIRNDLNEKERGDLILFSFAHPAIAGKIFVLYIKREKVKEVLQILLEENKEEVFDQKLDRNSVRRAKIYCTCLFVNIYIILTSATVEGIKNHIEEGVPIRTEVTFVPTRDDSGLLVNVFRFFIQLHWWFMVSIMCAIDFLSISSLVFLSYKFKRVRLHFEKFRCILIKEYKFKTGEVLDEMFRKNFVLGVKLHQHALRCSRKIQKSLGGLYSVQVCESISMLVTCLLKLTMNERNILATIKNLTFITCVILLNGAYMIAGGDVTYEASLISDSVFHSGWEYAKPNGSLRNLVVITLQRSQAPIRMTAFGVLSLSYDSFISVLRLSYSFFAVMY